jgi:hypothetical protein
MAEQCVPAQEDKIKEFRMESSQRHSIPAITHFAVLTAFLLPITLLPYAVVRRHLSTLRRKVDDVRLTAAASQREMQTLLANATERQKCVGAVIDKLKHEVDLLRLEAEGRQSARTASDNIVRSDFQQLLSERHHAR